MNIDYQRLYEDYLVSRDEKTRKLELDQFDNPKDHMVHWLQNVRGLSAEQAKAVIEHSPVTSQIEKEGQNRD